MENEKHPEVQLVSADTLQTIVKAETDVQMEIAQRFPRSLIRARTQITELACADQETAQACFFSLPRKRKNEKTGNYETIAIEGKSIRLAEIVASCWRNIKWGTRSLGLDRARGQVTVQAIVHDLESNNVVVIEEPRLVKRKDGTLYSDDMINMTERAAKSIALRNAIFQVVPDALIKPCLKEIKAVAIGEKPGTMLTEAEREQFEKKKLPISERAQNMVSKFVEMGVPRERILFTLGVKDVKEIDAEKFAAAVGLWNGINSGEYSLAEAFETPIGEREAEKAKAAADTALKGRKKADGKQAEIPLSSIPTDRPLDYGTLPLPKKGQ